MKILKIFSISACISFTGAYFIFSPLALAISPLVLAHDEVTQKITEPNFKVAFIGDQGIGKNARSVLRLIKNERADLVLHQGDFDYTDNPDAWDREITDIFGEDFPYFASIGNHDVAVWAGYQQKLKERLSRVQGAECSGDLGVRSSCTYKGLFFILSGAGTTDEGHEEYIREELAKDDALWSVCSWHKNQRLMQVGGKSDETGWGVYEECRKGGAIIATGHEHSYSRTHLMESFPLLKVSSISDTLELEKGKSFAFVSGLAGHSIRAQILSGDWWAKIYTSTQGADFGALFCEFYVDNKSDTAQCYFKDIQGRIADEFTIVSKVEVLSEQTENVNEEEEIIPEIFPAPTNILAPKNGETEEIPIKNQNKLGIIFVVVGILGLSFLVLFLIFSRL